MEILAAGAPARQTLDGIRTEREKVTAEIEQAAHAALNLDETVGRLLGSLDERRERAQAFATGFARPDSMPDRLGGDDLLGFFAWLDPKAFEAQLRRRLKEMLPPQGLPIGARAAAIAKLKARLVELDVAEERAICKLEADGFAVDRRADVDLAMLLAVWDTA